jgi:hypothetical protein
VCDVSNFQGKKIDNDDIFIVPNRLVNPIKKPTNTENTKDTNKTHVRKTNNQKMIKEK